MQVAKQLSVGMANKPGRLATMLSALAKEKVGLRALSVMDSGERGRIRFVPDELDAAVAVLDQMNVRYDAVDVLLVDMPNQPGAFTHICERLAEEHLNIDYAYCSLGAQRGTKSPALAVIRVNNLSKAQKVLSDNGSTSRRKQPGRRPVHAR